MSSAAISESTRQPLRQSADSKDHGRLTQGHIHELALSSFFTFQKSRLDTDYSL
jgi:hypothetical protein